MKVAINCSFFIPDGGGIKQYIYNLVTNLYLVDKETEYILYVYDDKIEYAKSHFPNTWKIKSTGFLSGHPIRRSLFEDFFWKKEEQLEGFDIYHSPFFHSPRLRKAKIVLTVHDLRFQRYPQTYSLLRYLFLKYKVRISIKKADYLIAISGFTKNEIIKYYRVPESRIRIIHEAIDKQYFNDVNVSKNGIDQLQGRQFILSVGHLEPRKNYENLINAFEKVQIQKQFENLHLVIVGKKSFGYRNVLDLVERNSSILYTDFVDDEVLLWLYKNAELFIFPSIYEGFGFPPLEAAALGTPSVVSSVSSIPEICGDAAIYFDPTDVDDIANKIIQALQIPKSDNGIQKRLQNNLNRFSWKQNAEETLSCYKEIYRYTVNK